jgi:hypothetical protein
MGSASETLFRYRVHDASKKPTKCLRQLRRRQPSPARDNGGYVRLLTLLPGCIP